MSDNDDLDQELLALAGDDDSSGAEDNASHHRQSRSPSVEQTSTSRAVAARSTAKKVNRQARNPNARKTRANHSDDDGEASIPSSPNSMGSAAMDESESDSSPADLGEDAPLYPIEGKFKSESDRSRILSMTEIEREEILAERAHEVEKRAQDLQLRRILQQRHREEASHDKTKKRKGDAAGLDDDSRGPRAKRSLNPVLDKYKEQRQLKSDQKARAEERKRGPRSPSRDDLETDRDADAESEVEFDEPKVSREEPAVLKDFNRIRVGRSNFSMICFNPTFETAIKGCFCRVNIGVSKDDSTPQYRMAQIKGFVTGRAYQMETDTGKPFVTDQYALLAHGKAEKEWPFIACSDSTFTEAELDKYKRALATDNIRIPQRKFLHAKCDDINALLKHSWTESEISNKVARKNAMWKKFATQGREKLVKRRDEAAARGDDVVVARLEQELAAMDAGGSGRLGPTASKPNRALAQQERLAALNKANRKANTEEVRKAQMAEKRAQQKAREEAIAKARLRDSEAAKKLLAPGDDLFGEASDISRTGTPANGANPVSKPPLNGSKTLGGLRKKAMDDEVIASMDLGIDIQI